MPKIQTRTVETNVFTTSNDPTDESAKGHSSNCTALEKTLGADGIFHDDGEEKPAWSVEYRGKVRIFIVGEVLEDGSTVVTRDEAEDAMIAWVDSEK